MSGVFAQIGAARELLAAPASVTAGTGTAGTPNIATLTFGAAHNMRVGDVFTLSGATPSGWNGTWAVATVVDATHLTFQTGTTLLANTTVQPTVSNVSQWGVFTTVSRFFEFVPPESLKGDYGRVVSKSLRSGSLVGRSNEFVPYIKGGGGDLTLEVWSKGFGYWLAGMLGTVTTTGPNADGMSTHTGTIGSLRGVSYTVQKGVPSSAAGTVYTFTYNGMKVTAWTLECDVDGTLTCKLSFDGQTESLTVPLAVAAYPSSPELLSFVAGTVTVAGTQVAIVKKWSVTMANTLAADRRAIAPSPLQSEQLANGERTITVTMDAEFYDNANLARYTAATAAGTMAAVVLKCVGQTIVGSAPGTPASLTITMPNFRLDGETPTVASAALPMAGLPGVALNTPGQNDAITIAYVTSDATP